MKRRLELWSLVCAAFAIGWMAAPLAQGAAQAPPWQGRPGKANWLIDGGDPQKNAWQRNETLITKESVRNMKLAWKLQLDNQPRQMHNLFPPLIVSDVTTAERAEGDRDRRGDLRQRVRHRRRQGHAALEAQVRQHVRRTDRRARARRVVSGRVDGNAGDRPGRRRRQVHRLRHLVGRPAAQAGRGHGRRDRAGGTVPAAQRQAVCAEPARQRALHDDRPGLRRQSERLLFLRSRDQEGRPVPARQRRHVAALRRDARQGRHALRRVGRRRLLPRAADLRPEHHRLEAGPRDQGDGPEGLVRADQRLLAAQARSRHERHRADLRLEGQGVPGPVEQGVPAVAARHRRARRRGSPHAGQPYAARLQRRRQLRGGRDVGRAGVVGRQGWHPLRADAVLGAEALAVQGADRVRRGDARRGRGLQTGGEARREGGADARLAVARHGSGRAAGRGRHQRRLCLRQRREHRPGRSGAGPGVQHRREPDRAFHPRDHLRARRPHGEGAVVERRPDHLVQPLQRPLGRQRSRLHRHV